ncbi:MAG: YbgF trimerization domain-containing protein [Gammaproteobacteria bacterium]
MNKKFFVPRYWGIFIVVIMIYSPLVWSRPSSNLLELESRIIELENKLQNNLNLEMANKLDFLQREVQELRGIIEEQQNLLAKINLNIIKDPVKLDKDKLDQ